MTMTLTQAAQAVHLQEDKNINNISNNNNNNNKTNSSNNTNISRNKYDDLGNEKAQIPPQSVMAYIIRIGILYFCGVCLSLLLIQLLKEHKVGQVAKSTSIFLQILVVSLCGLASIILGIGFPIVDDSFNLPHKLNRDWPNVFRLVGLFVGLNYAGA
eukprot:Pgem_evm1s14198